MKYLILSIMAVCMIAFAAMATSPPEPPAHGIYLQGWGMNPYNWDNITGSYGPVFGIYDPVGGSGGTGWHMDWTTPAAPTHVVLEPIDIELWMELYCTQAYHYTTYQYHRRGDGHENLCWMIEGTVSQNHNSWVMLTKSTDFLTHLWFREDIFGRTEKPTYGTDLPITWTTRWGNGLVYEEDIVVNWTGAPWEGNNIGYRIPACDHWFQFKGCVGDIYHVADGYYSLTMAGCPAPEL